MHAVAEVHDTRDIAAPVALGGVVWSDQVAVVNLVAVFDVPSGPTQSNGCPGWELPHT
jgi:hypothetical protein